MTFKTGDFKGVSIHNFEGDNEGDLKGDFIGDSKWNLERYFFNSLELDREVIGPSFIKKQPFTFYLFLSSESKESVFHLGSWINLI